MTTIPRMTQVATSVLLLATMLGCSESSTRFEELRDGIWETADWELTRVQSQRQGERTLAHFVMEGPGNQRIMLECHLRVDPQASFAYGSWTHIRGVSVVDQGVIQATSVDFLGGQGGTPSLGGHFVLRYPDGTDRYRVIIPPTEAVTMQWGGN